MKIVCHRCKHETDHCPNCGSADLQRDTNFNKIFLIVMIIVCGFTAYRWYSALDDYEYAQRLRRSYLKEKLETQPKLPFAK
jgi:hypothetical protein